MSPEPASDPERPITSLTDPRAISILSTEHWSLLSARSLAYNEAFARGGMFLTFLSMSFVALALLSAGMTFGRDFLVVAAVVLGFDIVIGLATYVRIFGANADDLRAVRGMARIRHAYVESAPIVARYFTAPVHDDIDSLVTVYGASASSRFGEFVYALSTSGGMIGLITAMVAGVLAGVVGLLAGVGGVAAVWLGVAAALAFFGFLVWLSFGGVLAEQQRVEPMFPAPAPGETPGPGGEANDAGG